MLMGINVDGLRQDFIDRCDEIGENFTVKNISGALSSDYNSYIGSAGVMGLTGSATERIVALPIKASHVEWEEGHFNPKDLWAAFKHNTIADVNSIIVRSGGDIFRVRDWQEFPVAGSTHHFEAILEFQGQ